MRKLIFAIIALLIVGAGLLAAGKKMFHFKKTEEERSVSGLAIAHTGNGPEMNGDEKKILKELREIMAAAEDAGQAFYVKGTILSEDPANSKKEEDRFVFYNNGSAVYCLSADLEVVYDKAFFVTANREAGSILVAPPKLSQPVDIPFSALSKNLKEEGYKLEKNYEANGNAVIRMYCENHIICKEMKLVYNESEKKPLSVSYLLTDSEHFDDAAFDKKVFIKIEEWSKGNAALVHPFPKIITVAAGVINPATGYENMNVINLNNQE